MRRQNTGVALPCFVVDSAGIVIGDSSTPDADVDVKCVPTVSCYQFQVEG